MKLFLLLLLVTLSTAAIDKPNILFILSDNQSYYEMGCHGHATVKTPSIDRLASRSMDFRRFYSPPFCSPSRAVIMTGSFAMKSGVHNTIGGRSIMHTKDKTIADILKANGYKTSIFGKWHLGFSYPYRPKDRGFDEVFVHGGGGVGQMEDYYGNTLFDTTFIHNDKVFKGKGYCTDIMFNQAMSWLEENKDSPFFCFVSTPVTHSPHHGPKELVEKLKMQGVKGNLELFGQIQNLDTNIGKIIDKVKELGLEKKTIIIFASDQGMNDRGAPHGDNRLGLGYDPAHHSPFMVHIPGGKTGINNDLTGMIDFFPTILDFCGLSVPDYVDGLSLKPLVTDEGSFNKERVLIVQCPRGRTAQMWKNSSVKRGPWRLVEGNRLFNINTDPRQKKDRAADNPEIVAQLRAEYEKYWNSLPDQATTLCRHIIGDPECPETVLNGMDWYTGSSPWNKSQFKKKKGNGAWAVTVKQDGKYTVECRFYPREADKSMDRTSAKIKIGTLEKEISLDPKAKAAVFEIDLKAGNFDLQTWLKSEKADTGALFVYIKKN